MAVAYTQAFAQVLIQPYAIAGANQCFPQRCQACSDSFAGEPVATYNCAGKCGLCDLCEGRAPGQIADCERWCTVGQEACVENCEAGRAACVGCAGACAAQGLSYA